MNELYEHKIVSSFNLHEYRKECPNFKRNHLYAVDIIWTNGHDRDAEIPSGFFENQEKIKKVFNYHAIRVMFPIRALVPSDQSLDISFTRSEDENELMAINMLKTCIDAGMKFDIIVYEFGKDGSVIRTNIFESIVPVEISRNDLSWNYNDQIATLDVKFLDVNFNHSLSPSR